MRKIIKKLSFVSLGIMLLIAGCNKEGNNDWLYSESETGNGAFRPVENLKGECGYGYGYVRWDLPESVDGLSMIDVSWTNAENVTEYKKLTHFEDSLWVFLEASEYIFRVTSCGTAGERVMDSIIFHVPDWKAEPVEIVQNLSAVISENIVTFKWETNTHRAFSKTTFEVWDAGENLVSTIVRTKDESTTAKFTGLDYFTDYELRYYSENLAGIATETVIYDFKTKRKAPTMPVIEVDDTQRGTDLAGNHIAGVYAYSSDIKWSEPEAGTDSLRISFVGLNDENYEFRFKASGNEEGKRIGWLTFLPGGKTTINVSIKYVNDEEWSEEKEQEIETKNPESVFTFRVKNGPNKSGDKLWEAFSGNYNGGSVHTPYTYKQLYDIVNNKKDKTFLVYWKPCYLDELELCPTMEVLNLGGTSYPTNAAQAPALREFIRVVDHLPKLTKIIIPNNYGGTLRNELLDTFTKSNYPNLQLVDPTGNDIQK